MRPGPSIGAVILAAGASRRLGQPKQLLPFRGKTLLQHLLDETAGMVFSSRVLVLGAYADQIQAATKAEHWTVALNEDWQSGMGGSLRLGVGQSLKEYPGTEHLLFLLSDQPLVTAHFLNTLIDQHIQTQSLITASEYQGSTGVPAVFSQACFAGLMTLTGDQGARKLLKAYERQVLRLPFEGGGFDIDTPEDVARLGRLV